MTIDKFLRAGAKLDWISPTYAAFRTISNGPSVKIEIPLTGTWTATKIEKAVRKYGIDTWGLDLDDHYVVSFKVRKDQEGYTWKVMEQLGLIDSRPKPQPIHAATQKPVRRLSVQAARWRCPFCGTSIPGGVWSCTQCGGRR